MAGDKKNDKDKPVNPPAPTPSPSTLSAFLESLKKNSTEKKQINIPENFVKELKDTNSILKTLQKGLTAITKSGKDLKTSLGKLEKITTQNFSTNKETLKTLQKNTEILTNINKLIELQPKEKDEDERATEASKVNITNAPAKNNTDTDTAKDVLAEQKTQPVSIVDISDEGIRKLQKVFDKIGIKTPKESAHPIAQQSSNGQNLLGSLLSNSLFGKLFSSNLLGLLGALGASLALAIGSWFNSGPFKGLMKEIGLIGTNVLWPLVKKSFSIFEDIAPKFTKGLMSAFGKVGELFSVGTGKIALQFTKMFPTLAKFLGPILKRLPVIGTIINLGSAVSRFIQGDIIGGLIDIGSAVATIIPGVGTAISIGLGFLNAARDITGESKKSAGDQVGDVTGVLKKVWEWLKDKIVDQFTSSFRHVKRGWTEFKAGDYGRAITTWAGIIPGLGWMESLYNWAFGERATEKVVKPDPGFVDQLWEKIKDGISAKWDSAKESVKDAISAIGIAVESAWDSITSWFGSVKDSIEDLIGDPVGTLKGMWESVTDKIKDLINAPINAVKNGWKKFTNWFGKLDENEPQPVTNNTKASGVNKVAPNIVSASNTGQSIAKETGASRVAPNITKIVAAAPTVETDADETDEDQDYTTPTAVVKSPVPSTPNTSSKNLVSKHEPIAPLSIPVQPSLASSIKDLNKNVASAIQTNKHPLPPPQSKSTNVTTSTQASNVSNNTTVFGDTLDRDIPYIERNKYRQQLLYIRGLL